MGAEAARAGEVLSATVASAGAAGSRRVLVAETDVQPGRTVMVPPRRSVRCPVHLSTTTSCHASRRADVDGTRRVVIRTVH